MISKRNNTLDCSVRLDNLIDKHHSSVWLLFTTVILKNCNSNIKLPLVAHRFGKLILVTLATLLLTLTVSAKAQDKYPDKPIRVIVPFPAGGINDNIARLIMQKLGESMDSAFLIDNRPGAGGTMGTAMAARSVPDGYTLLLGAASTIAVAPSMYTNPGYVPGKDFMAVGGLASVPSVLLTAKGDQFKRLQDLATAAKARPGALTFGSAGSGSSQHIQMELLKIQLNLDLLHVPYKGGAPAMADLISGQIDFLLEPLPTAMPQMKSKRLTALALSTNARLKTLPDVPTFAESGVPDFLVTTWFGLFAPTHTPLTIIHQLEAGLNKVLKDPALVKIMNDRGIDPMPMSSQDLKKYSAEEQKRWNTVVTQSGIQAN